MRELPPSESSIATDNYERDIIADDKEQPKSPQQSVHTAEPVTIPETQTAPSPDPRTNLLNLETESQATLEARPEPSSKPKPPKKAEPSWTRIQRKISKIITKRSFNGCSDTSPSPPRPLLPSILAGPTSTTTTTHTSQEPQPAKTSIQKRKLLKEAILAGLSMSFVMMGPVLSNGR
jgi:hypothetical protein